MYYNYLTLSDKKYSNIGFRIETPSSHVPVTKKGKRGQACHDPQH